jgi:hypothetical protein
MKKYNLLLTILIIFFLTGCAGQEKTFQTVSAPPPAQTKLTADDEVRYLAYNLWYKRPEKIYCLNYQTGAVLPAGTKVNTIILGTKRKYKTIKFKTVEGKQNFQIFWNEKFHPGKTINDFAYALFSEKTFAEQTQGLTQAEIDNIHIAHVDFDMSKEAVLMALGPPPEHQTHSHKNNIWMYWRNKFGRKRITFGSDNRVYAIK